MSNDLHEQLLKYLSDAHSIEEQSIAQLEKAPDIAGEPALSQALREHLSVTKGHERTVRMLLESHGASPSRVKDAIMRAGGDGFIWFARSQPDTPGKLAAHALSYEALEWAAWDLLARTAERTDATETAAAARTIRDQEREMMDRIEGLFDRTTEASLDGDDGNTDMNRSLHRYLADAHAIEAQSIQLLESAKGGLDDHPMLSRLFQDHLEESKRQQEHVEARLEALGGSRSFLKDAALRMGAFSWSAFFLGQPDTSGKLMAFAYAFEHLEIGGYEQLRRVAARAGDRATAEMAAEISRQERQAATRLAGAFDEAVSAALSEVNLR